MAAFTTATLATAALVASAAGAAISAYGAYQQGQALKAQGTYQAAVLRNNKILADRAAADAVARGKSEASKREQQGRALIGRQRAVLASNGVDVNSGSAVDIQADTEANTKLDADMIRANAEREALGYRTQGMNFDASASLATLRGDQAGANSLLSAGGTLLSGAGSVASKWYQFDNMGAFNAPKTPNLGVYNDYAG